MRSAAHPTDAWTRTAFLPRLGHQAHRGDRGDAARRRGPARPPSPDPRGDPSVPGWPAGPRDAVARAHPHLGHPGPGPRPVRRSRPSYRALSRGSSPRDPRSSRARGSPTHRTGSISWRGARAGHGDGLPGGAADTCPRALGMVDTRFDVRGDLGRAVDVHGIGRANAVTRRLVTRFLGRGDPSRWRVVRDRRGPAPVRAGTPAPLHGRADAPRILSEQGIELMTREHTQGIPESLEDGTTREPHYALGWRKPRPGGDGMTLAGSPAQRRCGVHPRRHHGHPPVGRPGAWLRGGRAQQPVGPRPGAHRTHHRRRLCQLAGRLTAGHRERTTGRTLLDGHVDERAPLGARAVVVADPRIADQLVDHEPRVGRTLTDPAVGDALPVGGHALGGIVGGERVRVLEGAVLVDGLRPGCGRGARDTPGTRCSLSQSALTRAPGIA